MTVTPEVFIESKFAENSQTTQYTVPASSKAIIDTFVVTNTTTSSVTFSCNLVPSAGSAADSNLLIDAKAIAPGETYVCFEVIGQLLKAGAFISTICSASSALSMRSTGRVST